MSLRDIFNRNKAKQLDAEPEEGDDGGPQDQGAGPTVGPISPATKTSNLAGMRPP